MHLYKVHVHWLTWAHSFCCSFSYVRLLGYNTNSSFRAGVVASTVLTKWFLSDAYFTFVSWDKESKQAKGVSPNHKNTDTSVLSSPRTLVKALFNFHSHRLHLWPKRHQIQVFSIKIERNFTWNAFEYIKENEIVVTWFQLLIYTNNLRQNKSANGETPPIRELNNSSQFILKYLPFCYFSCSHQQFWQKEYVK